MSITKEDVKIGKTLFYVYFFRPYIKECEVCGYDEKNRDYNCKTVRVVNFDPIVDEHSQSCMDSDECLSEWEFGDRHLDQWHLTYENALDTLRKRYSSVLDNIEKGESV